MTTNVRVLAIGIVMLFVAVAMNGCWSYFVEREKDRRGIIGKQVDACLGRGLVITKVGRYEVDCR